MVCPVSHWSTESWCEDPLMPKGPRDGWETQWGYILYRSDMILLAGNRAVTQEARVWNQRSGRHDIPWPHFWQANKQRPSEALFFLWILAWICQGHLLTKFIPKSLTSISVTDPASPVVGCHSGPIAVCAFECHTFDCSTFVCRCFCAGGEGQRRTADQTAPLYCAV